ncbi:MAG TPA: 16S rRNA (guanine(527)-N(7))-methyltransferase RsmG [Sphingomicrobium sp.]|nr:16S rRNA (guanine(527)-N(7))-methyltransferase RsmG [Sphingomicrobium sp.]
MSDLSVAAGRAVPRETIAKLECYAALIREENRRQNLVSRSTLDTLWGRHIVDSAQLARFEPFDGASWLDIGSGAGLPGLVLAALVAGPVTLVEPRRLRADFLQRAAAELDLVVTVHLSKVEALRGRFDSITARAVASVDRLLHLGAHLAHSGTKWVLPKGKSAQSELAEARRNWQCAAQVEPSITDPESAILLLSKVRAKEKR